MTDETLFAAALESPDRTAFLAASCPDPEQRARIERLLAAHDRASGFLRSPVVSPVGVETSAHDSASDDDLDDAIAFLTPSTRPGSLGRIGHYEVLEVLGRGGFGIVFRAFDEVLQRVVAVKVLAPSMAATSPARKRFLREARSSAAIRHENVVQVHAVEEQPLPHLVMEFVPGETLQQRIDRTGPLDTEEVLRTSRHIAEGLVAAHAAGVVHRDIKPSNILIEKGPPHRVRITDFGLARAADDASLTRSGIVAGTPMYMAPEQAKGETLDHRADLFSLGSVMYTMLTGHPPFRAESTLAVLKRVADDTPRPIREVIPETPEWLCRIVEKLHAKNPDDRFQSAREVADVLADCESQLAAHKEIKDFSRIPGAKPTLRRFRRARPRLALACVAVSLLIAAASVFGKPARLYVTNRGEMEILPADGLGSVIVLKNDEGILDGNKVHDAMTDWLGMKQKQTLKLPPGKYQLNVGTYPMGTEVFSWEVTTTYPFPYGETRYTTSVVNTSAIITVERGCRVTLRPVMRSAAPTPPSNAPKPPEPPNDLAQLAGTWRVLNGHVFSTNQPNTSIITTGEMDIGFDGDRFTVRRSGTERHGTFTIDTEKKQLLLELQGARVPVRCTYRFEGNKLSLDFPRPRESKDGDTTFFVPDDTAASVNNLKQLGIAFHNYHETNNALPRAAIMSADGKPLLSWRVALLPHLDQMALYKQFKLDEPWDSEHNKKLVEKMPAVFAAPALKLKEPGLSNYRVFVGPGAVFEPAAESVRFQDFTDPLSQTILAVESVEPVIWTKPDDLPFDPKKPLPLIGWYRVGLRALMGDGSVTTLTPSISADAIKMLITRNGGEIISADEVMKREPLFGPALRLQLQRQITPPPPVVLRTFDPAKDKAVPPIWAKPSCVTVEDGAWRIENSENAGNFHVTLGVILDNIPDDGLLVFRAKVKVKANHKFTWGSLQLGNASPSFHNYDWPDSLREYRGDVAEWTQKEVRYPVSVFRKKNPPSVDVNVGLHANGVLWVKDAQVLHIPEVVQTVKPIAPKALRDAVDARAKSRNLMKQRFEAGRVSKIEMAQAEADLAEAEIALAEAENDTATVYSLLNELVKHRQEERDGIALRVESGIEAVDTLNQADARLAAAKTRLSSAKKPTKP